jgi:predicted nucleic acid-binding protein
VSRSSWPTARNDEIYVHTTTLSRDVLGEPNAIETLRAADRLISSELLAVEARPTFDRLYRSGGLPASEVGVRLRIIEDWLEAVDLVLVRGPVLARAGDPLPLPLGTLDAIHLASALVWRDRSGHVPTIATHDAALARAAGAHGLPVVGV